MGTNISSRIIFIICFVLLTFISTVRSNSKDLEVVDSVDIKNCSGLWYEIARIPNFFQDSSDTKVRITYKIREDGKLTIINKWENKDGSTTKAKGIAKVVDKETNAKLKLCLMNILGLNLYWIDYWIIGLDENHEFVVIGSPDRKHGWIISKEPTLPDSTLQDIFNLLENKGYDPDRFRMTGQ